MEKEEKYTTQREWDEILSKMPDLEWKAKNDPIAAAVESMLQAKTDPYVIIYTLINVVQNMKETVSSFGISSNKIGFIKKEDPKKTRIRIGNNQRVEILNGDNIVKVFYNTPNKHPLSKSLQDAMVWIYENCTHTLNEEK